MSVLLTARRVEFAAVLVVGVLLVVAAAGTAFLFSRRPGPDGLARRADPGPVVLADPAAGEVLMVSAVAVDSGDDQPAIATVVVTPPAGSEEMQLATSPLFTGVAWTPVATEAMMPMDAGGYQMIFGRFRLADGTVTDTVVTGAMVDRTVDAATSSADGIHRPSWVRPLSPTELVVRVEAGRLSSGSLVAYDLDNPPDGDRVTRGLIGPRMVKRDGEPFAFPVSERTDVVRQVDTLIGRPLDAGAVAEKRWTVTVTEPEGGEPEVFETPVRFVSRPTAGGVGGDGESFAATIHDFVVTLPMPIRDGVTYRVDPPADEVAAAELSFDSRRTISPAVRINQVGYSPGDGSKLAYLAGWFDGMGESAATSHEIFEVIAEDGSVVAKDMITLRPGGQDMGERDLTGTPVAEMDFSSLTTPGRYRVCVSSVGCSYDLLIEENPWHDLTAAVARATYHQRSGVELGPPHTSFTRPRPYHPDEGLEVLATSLTNLEATSEPETRFDALVVGATTEVIPEAWGGHFDAGDWDRRIQHLWYARNAAQLVSAFPGFFDQDLNIPESGDPVPDLLDEGLWSLDFYLRMQSQDGAIRGGVESSEHPPGHSTSWVDDLAVYALAPDPWSSYLYAGVAAEVSAALRPYDGPRAEQYLQSALAAAAWAEAQPLEPVDGDAAAVTAQRNVAAAALLLATGDRDWHDVFVETADYLTVGAGDDNMLCHAHTRCDGGWLYLQADEAVTDPLIRLILTDRFLASAETMVALADNTAYRWTTEDGNVPLIWGLGPGGAPKTSGLLRAYLLTGEERFRDAAVASAGYSLGANPFNTTLVTGVGDEQARYPVIVDAQHGGIPVWPGTPVYGHHQLNAIGNDQWAVDFVLSPAGANPSPTEVPLLWQWYDVSTIAFFNEFTVHQSHAEALFSFGVLAASSS